MNAITQEFEPSPIQVLFSKTRIKPDGHVGTIVITQGADELVLTVEQARTLAVQIMARLPLPEAI